VDLGIARKIRGWRFEKRGGKDAQRSKDAMGGKKLRQILKGGGQRGLYWGIVFSSIGKDHENPVRGGGYG